LLLSQTHSSLPSPASSYLRKGSTFLQQRKLSRQRRLGKVAPSTFLVKGTVSRDLSVGFLHQKAAPGLLRGTLRRFSFLPNIHRDIEQKVDSAVYDTPQNGDSVVYLTLRNGDSRCILHHRMAMYLTLRS